MEIVRLNNGRLYLSAKIRRKLGIKLNDSVKVKVYKDRIIIQKCDKR